MSLIMNASCVAQVFTVFGNTFTLKPGQIKNFTDAISSFIANERTDQGLVPLPDDFLDPQFFNTEEGKKALTEKKVEGVRNRVRRLKQLAYNETVSLKMDFDAKNLKADTSAFLSEKAMEQMEELATYIDLESAEDKERIERVKRLTSRIGKIEKQD